MKIFKTKSHIEELNQKLIKLEKRISDLCYENDKLKRIVKYHVPGKVTFAQYYNMTMGSGTYLYKDGEEYNILGLKLKKPIFTVLPDDITALLIADVINDSEDDSVCKRVEYVVDLRDYTYVRIK